MERNFKNEDFEQFLRQSADGLRMRPSEKVWKGISGSLNKRRRRFGFFLGISLLATSALGYYLLEPSNARNANSQLAQNGNAYQTENTINRNHPAGNGITGNKIVNGNQVTANPVTLDNLYTLAGTKQQGDRNDIRGTYSTAGTAAFLGLNTTASQSNDVPGATITPANGFTPTVVDSYPGNQPATEPTVKTEAKHDNAYPLTIESVTNAYAPKFKKGKLGLQMFFTPTVSYRRLRENKDYSGSNGFSTVNDLNSAVNHKPDFGLQVGLLAKYPVSQRMKVRGGLQFNVNRYDIKTYNSNFELATVRLNNRQSVAQMSGYNNFQGYKSDWLENLYLSISAPLGVEYKLGGNSKTSFGAATSIQPTYVIRDKAYLISTDYKNYMEVPWLVRKWNVSTGIETYVNYSTGTVKWQVGPQVRYQLLSSYDGEYPVKEHLFDFGLRVGISLNNR